MRGTRIPDKKYDDNGDERTVTTTYFNYIHLLSFTGNSKVKKKKKKGESKKAFLSIPVGYSLNTVGLLGGLKQ